MSLRRKVVIIGAGGHAKVIIDMLKSNPQFEIVGCTDQKARNRILGFQILGDDSILEELYNKGVCHAFVAVGNNQLRKKLAERALNIGFQLINVISPFAYIADSVRLGSGIAVMPGSVINADAQIMDNSIINTGASVDHECVVGEACHIAPGSAISGNVVIGEGAFLGTGTKIIDGITIGAWSIIGAGTVVIRDVPDRCLAVGVPAKVLKQLQ